MGTHPIFESDFDCLTERLQFCTSKTDLNVKLTSFRVEATLPNRLSRI